jgi:Domain of unknown function (DUF5122) beta-propeller
MRRLVLPLTAVVAIGALVGVGSAQARLDPGFGTNGVVVLNNLSPGGTKAEEIEAIATGQNGETYVVARGAGCLACGVKSFVYRYQTNGAREPLFGVGLGYEVPPAQSNPGREFEYGSNLVTVDSTGLPVIATVVPGRSGSGVIAVRRLLGDGTLDTAFGTAGTVTIPCPCIEEGTQLLSGPAGSTFVIAEARTRKKRNGSESGSTAAATLIKLDSTGHRAKGYGLRGSITAQMPGEGTIEYDAITPAGATFFGGRGLTGTTASGFLLKVTAKGKIDGKFKQRALKSLRRLKGLKGYEVRVTAAVIGRQGPIELFGSAGGIGGFELRLRQDGTLWRGWGKKGLKLLPFPIGAAVQGREGSTMALSSEEALPPRLLRILSNGKLDPVFGNTGEELPGATNESGFSIFPAGIGRVGVSDLGLRECRQVCEATPTLYRFLEGR